MSSRYPSRSERAAKSSPFAGDLDADTAPDLEFELDRLLGALPVLIDLSQVQFS